MKLTLIQEFMEFWRTQVIRVDRPRDAPEERMSKIIMAICLIWGAVGCGSVIALAAIFNNAWLLFLWVPWLIILIILIKFDGWYYRTHYCTWNG